MSPTELAIANAYAGEGLKFLAGDSVVNCPIQGPAVILLHLLCGHHNSGFCSAVPVENHRVHGHISSGCRFCQSFLAAHSPQSGHDAVYMVGRLKSNPASLIITTIILLCN